MKKIAPQKHFLKKQKKLLKNLARKNGKF